MHPLLSQRIYSGSIAGIACNQYGNSTSYNKHHVPPASPTPWRTHLNEANATISCAVGNLTKKAKRKCRRVRACIILSSLPLSVVFLDCFGQANIPVPRKDGGEKNACHNRESHPPLSCIRAPCCQITKKTVFVFACAIQTKNPLVCSGRSGIRGGVLTLFIMHASVSKVHLNELNDKYIFNVSIIKSPMQINTYISV